MHTSSDRTRRESTSRRSQVLFLSLAAFTAILVALAAGLLGIYVGVLAEVPALETGLIAERSAPIRIYDAGDPPALIAELAGPSRAEPVSPRDIPDTLRWALISTADPNFPSRRAMDLGAVVRILFAEVTGGSYTPVSPITRGFIRDNFAISHGQRRPRLYEAALAYRLERSWSKDRILTAYLNSMYFGEGCYGIGAAASRYFGKSVIELTAAEGAFLVGMALSAAPLAPRTNPQPTLAARDAVLNSMFQQGYLDGAALQAALAEPLVLKPLAASPVQRVPEWSDLIEDQLVKRYGAARVLRGGLDVYTTLDLSLQEAAETALAKVLTESSDPTGALVLVDLAKGSFVAMAQTRHDQQAASLLATHATGSLLAPLVLAIAFDRGISPLAPYNLDGTPVILAEAAAQDHPALLARLEQQLGIDAVSQTLAGLGIPGATSGAGITQVNAIELTIAEAASVFTTLATSGRLTYSSLAVPAGGAMQPCSITRVESLDGGIAEVGATLWQEVLRPDSAFLVTDILRSAPKPTPSAHEQDGRVVLRQAESPAHTDAWCAGYSRDLVAIVWVGYGDGTRPLTSLRDGTTSGTELATAIWWALMERLRDSSSIQPFSPPADVQWTTVDVCTVTGQRASAACPRRTMLLPSELIPSDTCDVHGGVSGTTTTPTSLIATTTTTQLSTITVPSVVGLTLAEAEARIAAAGLIMSISVGAPGAHPGHIVSQTPDPGTTAKPGQTVAVIVEALPPTPTATVPASTTSSTVP